MDLYLLIILGTAVTLLTVIIIGLTYYYFSLLKKFSKAQKENLYLRFHLQEKGLIKVNQARDKAMKIIQDATSQADEIIKKTHFAESDASESFKKQLEGLTTKQKEALDKASQELTSSFNLAIQDIQKEDTDLIKNSAAEMNKAVEHHVEELKDQLANETVNSQKSVDDKIQEAFTKAKEDIEKYKTERIGKIDQELSHVLAEVTKDIVGKRLSYEDHKDLILASLEKAKGQLEITT